MRAERARMAFMPVSVGVLSDGEASEPLAARIRAACGDGASVRLLGDLDPGTWGDVQVAVLPPLSPEAVAGVREKLESWLMAGHGLLALVATRGESASAAVIEDILETPVSTGRPGPWRLVLDHPALSSLSKTELLEGPEETPFTFLKPNPIRGWILATAQDKSKESYPVLVAGELNAGRFMACGLPLGHSRPGTEFHRQVNALLKGTLAWLASPAATSPEESLTLSSEALTVKLVDNRRIAGHRPGFSGILSLSHRGQGHEVTASQGSLLNFQYVGYDSLQSPRYPGQGFDYEPRASAMRLERLDAKSARLVQPALPCRGLETVMKYTVSEPHYLDFEFTITPRKACPTVNPRMGALFSSSINKPGDAGIYVLGTTESHPNPIWLRLSVDQAGAAMMAESTETGEKAPFTGWFLPLYYGLVQGYLYLLMFSTAEVGGMEETQLVMPWLSTPTTQAKRPNWDFVFTSPFQRINETRLLRGRLVYKKFVSREDVTDEYRNWAWKAG